MPRATEGRKRKSHRKKILKIAKGYRGRRGTNYKAAKDAVTKALSYAYVSRKDKKGVMRRLWITRINAAVRPEGLTYSRFMEGLSKAGVAINRKALSNMAIEDPATFKSVVDVSKKALGV